MDKQDYIKEAVGLADGLYWTDFSEWLEVHEWDEHVVDDPDQAQRDIAALAAQLTEQVDATDYRLDIGPKGTVLYEPQGGMFESPGLNSDRAMNTIKVVVDSKVLH